jgi:hypothetical protein
MHNKLVALMQKRAGNSSVGPSTARGMGPPGTIDAAKDFFHKFNIRSIKARSKTTFLLKLDQTTAELMGQLPNGGQYWGSSRKFLNIFLRNCLYNKYLNEHYQLDTLEDWLEVPLDSHVGKGLKLENEGKCLPRWKTVIGLTPELSSEFQEVASKVAASKKLARVHLDILYWRGAHMAAKSINPDEQEFAD